MSVVTDSAQAAQAQDVKGKYKPVERLRGPGGSNQSRQTFAFTTSSVHRDGLQRARESVARALVKAIAQERLARHNVLDARTEESDVETVLIRNVSLLAAAEQLLKIWDGVQEVESNRLVSLGLVERSAIILYAVLQEVEEVGEGFLDPPIHKLLGTLNEIAEMFPKLAHRSFLKRYMKRPEALREIARCDGILRDALAASPPNLQKRVLHHIQQIEGVMITPDDVLTQTLPSTVSQMKAAAGTSVLRVISQRTTLENKLDSVQDAADLRSVLNRALTQDSEVELLRILELDRDEVPETMELLQRVVDDAEVPPAYSPGPGPPEYTANNTVDQKLLMGVIDALRRVSIASSTSINGEELNTPVFKARRSVFKAIMEKSSNKPRTSEKIATMNFEEIDSPASATSQFPQIYLPPGGRHLSPNVIPFRSADGVALNRELAAGGTVLSVCTVPDAVAWIEAHYDDPLLSAIRARNFEGPLAIPLSPAESALAIFGSIADTLIPQMAMELAQVSGFAILIRPSEDNPIPNLVQPVDTTPSGSVSGEATVGKVARLRGGAAEDDPVTEAIPQWEGEFHNETLDLRLKLSNDRVYDLNLCSFIKFKTQSMANSAGLRPHPEVLSFVSLNVKLRRGETQLDRSFSNIGLLARRPNSISNCEFLDVGYEPPDAVLKRIGARSTSGNIGVNAGLAGVVPAFAVNGGYTWGRNEGLESADNKPIPKCNVRYDPGRSWDPEEAQKAGQDFRSYDVAWFPETDRDKIAYEMRVELGLGINIRRSNLFHPRLPPISSIVRNQIVIWVKDPALRSQGRGVMLLTSTYIPDALTNECLTISSRLTADLGTASAPNITAAEAHEIPDAAGVSVSVAPLDKARKRKKPSRANRLLNKLPFKSSTSTGTSSAQQLPMYETVSRGWDPTNMRWRDVLWPTLDDQFRIIDSTSSERAAWKLEWDTEGTTVSAASAPETSAVPTVTVVTVPGPPDEERLTPGSASIIAPSMTTISTTTLGTDVVAGGPGKI